MSTPNAYDDLLAELREGETVEAVVFGTWGGGDPEWFEDDGYAYSEPEPRPVPKEKRGVVLTIDEARPMMVGWSFNGGYGSADCYAVRIWTNERVLWVTQYDGATSLSSAPRNPAPGTPNMPGGGGG